MREPPAYETLPPVVRRVVLQAADEFGVEVDDIVSYSNDRTSALARGAALFRVRLKTTYKVKEIADIMGRHPQSITNAVSLYKAHVGNEARAKQLSYEADRRWHREVYPVLDLKAKKTAEGIELP